MAKVTSVDRGACIRDLSQYPGEVKRGMLAHAHARRTHACTLEHAREHAHTHVYTVRHTHARSHARTQR